MRDGTVQGAAATWGPWSVRLTRGQVATAPRYLPSRQMRELMSAKQILVVDDEKNQRDILQLILSGERDEQGEQLYEVKTASSGQEALRAFKNENFDLVLTDLKMAGMDGIQLLNELGQLDSSTPVILMTAHGSINTVK